VSDMVEFTIIHAEPSTPIFLAHQHYWRCPGTGRRLDDPLLMHLLNNPLCFLSFHQGKSPQWLPDRWCFTSVDPVLHKVSTAKVMWSCGEDISKFTQQLMYLSMLRLTQNSNRAFIQVLQVEGKFVQFLSQQWACPVCLMNNRQVSPSNLDGVIEPETHLFDMELDLNI